ncbi:hypothetical protein NLJ89_g1836 [Agrocybe chaxingu]|uniref:SET domain-containing protein n=1 Tax=Agrocybe chaxingu TaxID=84603 RepID=A0A9W8TDP3_9AGAR|nr:hypothetical protein NLJ89_g1836 [Agrocybe chaxingu]
MKRGFLNTSKVKKQALYGQTQPQPHQLEIEKPVQTRNSSKSSGRVVDAGHPEGVVAGPLPSSTNENSLRTDHGKDAILVSTIPLHFEDGPGDPDGHSEWIVSGPTYDKILKSPSFPGPIPKPRRHNMYVVKPSRGMGLGVFATCDIEAGELIFSERPLLVYPSAAAPLEASNPYIRLSSSKGRNAQRNAIEYEQLAEVALERMTEEGRAAFLSLANAHGGDNRPLVAIIKTNGYLTNIGDEPDPRLGEDYARERKYGAVCEIGARINHSCSPNVTFWFKRSSFSMQVTAIKDIKAGQELFSSYCRLDQSAARRKVALAPYGFECKCAVCVHAIPATDKLHEEFPARVQRFSELSKGWIRAPRLDASVLDPLLQLEKDAIKEGLVPEPPYRRLLGIIEVVYAKLGMREKAGYYTEIRCRLNAIGKDD